MESVNIRVPATTANLSAGFDTLGCALSLYNRLRFSCSDRLVISGCDPEYSNSNNLAYLAFASVYRYIGLTPPGVHIHIEAEIPVSRGLGSSAALLAAGAAAANSLSKANLPSETLLQLTAAIEGHPDNLAPAFWGGLTASMMKDGSVYTVRYIPHSDLHFVAVSPDFPLSTSKARSVLPASVPFKDAVFNISRTAVLLRALETGEASVISAAMDDRLHQPYRIPLIDEFEDIRRSALDTGAIGVYLSGAGPTVMCLSNDPAFSVKLLDSIRDMRHNWTIYDLTADLAGICISE